MSHVALKLVTFGPSLYDSDDDMLQYFRSVFQKLDVCVLLGRKVPVELAPLKEVVVVTGSLLKTKAKTMAFVKKKREACSQVALLHRVSSIIYMWWEPGWHSQYRDKLWAEWCRVQILDLGPIQPPVLWVPGFFSRVRWPGHEVDGLPPSQAEVKNVWSYLFPVCTFRKWTGTALPLFIYM